MEQESGKEAGVTQAQRNQKILAAIAEQTARAISSKKVARETLINEGIYTAGGKLRPEFGGSKKGRAAA